MFKRMQDECKDESIIEIWVTSKGKRKLPYLKRIEITGIVNHNKILFKGEKEKVYKLKVNTVK